MTMIKTILLTGLVSTLVASSSAFAAGTNGSSRFAPGQEVKHHARGSVGASGYAPGRIYNDTGKKSVKGHPGASGYAPGQR
jgi:hypothetical protein